MGFEEYRGCKIHGESEYDTGTRCCVSEIYLPSGYQYACFISEWETESEFDWDKAEKEVKDQIDEFIDKQTRVHSVYYRTKSEPLKAGFYYYCKSCFLNEKEIYNFCKERFDKTPFSDIWFDVNVEIKYHKYFDGFSKNEEDVERSLESKRINEVFIKGCIDINGKKHDFILRCDKTKFIEICVQDADHEYVADTITKTLNVYKGKEIALELKEK